MNKRMLYLALPIVMILTPLSTYAQGIEITSTGNITVTGAATIDISDGGIINNGTYTTGTETVTLSGTTAKSISGGNALTVNNLVISSTGTISLDNSVTATTLTINPNAKVTNSSSKTLAGTTLNIKSDATGTGTYIDDGTATTFTNTNVEQYLTGTNNSGVPNGRGYYISSPVATATSNVFSASGNNGLYYHTESATALQGYTEITTDNVDLAPMQGYLVRVGTSQAYTFTGGALNNSVKYTTPLMSRTGAVTTRRGFHLIGNPYPSFLNWYKAINVDFKDASTTNNISSTIYYRTVNAVNVHVFDTYNAANDEGTDLNGSPVTRFIPPMQAVWVRVEGADGGTGTLAFNQSMREHVSGAKLRSTEVYDKQSVRLRVSNGSNEDETILLFSPRAMDELDAWDSPKMSNNNTAIPEIYTYAESEKAVINGMTEKALEKELILGFKTGKAGTFSIKLSENKLTDGSYILLKDKQLNIEQNLSEAPVYEFYSDIVATDSRFTLTVSRNATALDFESMAPSINVYQSNKNEVTVTINGPLKPNSSVSIYNTLGQRIVTSPIISEETVLNNLSKPGVYLISVDLGGRKSVSKLVINNL